MKLASLGSAFAALSLLITPAFASPVTWNLYGTYDDGAGVVTGSYTYDADTGAYTDIMISTTEGETFTAVNPVSSGNASTLIFVEESPIVPNVTLEAAFGLADAMTNAGGSIAILAYPAGFTIIGQCDDDCSSITGPFRFLQSGFVTTDDLPPNAVPVPGAAFLFAPALAAFGALRRKSRSA